MSKSQSSPLFDQVNKLEDFFGCRLRFVDQSLIHIQKTYGYLEWMRGRNMIKLLPGYDATTLGNKNFLILRTDSEWKMIHWLCENNINGWSIQRIIDGISFTNYFYFQDDGDRALARLSS